MKRTLLPGMSGALLVVFVLAGCSSDPNGLPFGVTFVNWTDQPLTIVDVGTGGDEEVLVSSLKARSADGLSMRGDQFGRCSRGTYVARDSNGVEVARQPDNHCHNWTIALSPVSYAITNPSSEAIEVLYQGTSLIEITPRLASGDTITGKLDDLGDLSDLCTSGVLAARPLGPHTFEPSTPPYNDRSIPRQAIGSCQDWTWSAECIPSNPGEPRPSGWGLDVPWPRCS